MAEGDPHKPIKHKKAIIFH